MADRRAETAVLVMAYGTPRAREDLEAYYTHIRRGLPPSAAQLADLRARYDAIGGVSPLRGITEAQAAGIQAALPDGYVVHLGLKHAPPFIEDAVAAVREAGAARLVALVLAPHYSTRSVGEYLARVRAAAGEEIDVRTVETWHTEDGYVDLLTGYVAEAFDRVGTPPDRTAVLFTAHSLPTAVVEAGDAYPDRVHETAALVAERLDLPRWRTAWQSAGATAEPWLVPDVLEVIPDLDADGVVVCACGFVADHLEVLYDVDVEAREAAGRAGLAFARTRMPNDDPRFCATLAELVVTADRMP